MVTETSVAIDYHERGVQVCIMSSDGRVEFNRKVKNDIDALVEALGRERTEVFDADATDIPLHGKQEGRFYHGYYGHYCYLPLYIVCEEFPLWAELRPANIDASRGTEAALRKIVPALKAALPSVQIILRADSGFAREGIMRFCEENGIDFILGPARNSRLTAELAEEMQTAQLRTGRHNALPAYSKISNMRPM